MNSQSRTRTTVRPGASVVAMGSLMITLLAACATPTPPVWLDPALDDCQKGIEGEASKLDKKIFAALKKCKDLYRKAVVAGDPLTDAGADCQTALAKVLTFPDVAGKSSMAKAKLKLDDLTDPAGPKCSDANLIALGHPPVATTGDLWARLVMVQRLKQAVEGQIALVTDTAAIFQELSANGCVLCSSIAAVPCRRATCTIGGGSQNDIFGLGVFAIAGNISLDACANTDILGPDLGLYAGLKQPLPAPTPAAGTTACLRTTGARGVITGPGTTRPSVDVATCQDHIDGDGDECPALLGSGALCATVQSDAVHGGVSNSGACVALSTGAMTAGESFALVAAEFALTCDNVGCGGDTRGPDALPCTEDDTSTVYRFSFPITTGDAETSILDGNNTNGNTLSTGVAISGATVSIGTNKKFSGTWVTAVPAIHALSGNFDAANYITLQCN